MVVVVIAVFPEHRAQQALVLYVTALDADRLGVVVGEDTESIRLFYTSVSLLLSHTQGYCYHLSKFHIYVLVYCIGVCLSGLLHSV